MNENEDGRDDQTENVTIPEPWIPPETYQFGPIPGVPADVMACIPDRGMVHEYVWWATQCTYASPIYHVGAIIPVLAWDLANRGWQFGSRGKQIALQSFLIGDSSTGKSTALRLVKKFHEELLARITIGWQAIPIGADARTAQIASENTAKLNPWILASGTAPGLLEQLFERFNPITNTTPVLLHHEEVAHVLARKKDHAIADILLELFDAVPKVERHIARYREMQRKGQQAPSIVRMPAVSAVFCGTPVSIKDKLDASAFEGGLVSRSIWLTGRPDMSRWWLQDRDRSVARSMIIDRWIHYTHHHHGLEAVRGHDARVIHLDQRVKRLCIEALYPAFEKAVRQGDTRLAAALGRSLEHAEMVAAVFAWSRGQTSISEADMNAATRLLGWSTRTVAGLSDATSDDEDWTKGQRVYGLINDASPAGLRKSELYPKLQCSKATLDKLLATLLDQGVITEFRSTATGPGRPATLYRVTGSGPGPNGKLIEFAKYRKEHEKDE